jgi:hypothetical protein
MATVVTVKVNHPHARANAMQRLTSQQQQDLMAYAKALKASPSAPAVAPASLQNVKNLSKLLDMVNPG